MITSVGEVVGDDGMARIEEDQIDDTLDGEEEEENGPAYFDGQELNYTKVLNDDIRYPLRIIIDPRNRTGTLLLSDRIKDIQQLIKGAKEMGTSTKARFAEISYPSLGSDHFTWAKWALGIYFLNEHATWFVPFKDRINKGLDALKKPRLREDPVSLEKEIFNFLGFLCASHYYNRSPTVLTDIVEGKNFCASATQLMTRERFMEILNALSHTTESHGHIFELGEDDHWTAPSAKLAPLQKSTKNLAEQGYDIGHADDGFKLFSLDDVKIHNRSKTGHEIVQYTFQRGGQPGPTMIAIVDKHTGMIFGAKWVQHGESMNDISIELAKTAAGSADFNNVLLAADRGIFTPVFTKAVLDGNGHLVGTVSQGKTNTPIHVVKKLLSDAVVTAAGDDEEAAATVASGAAAGGPATTPIWKISSFGARSAYWMVATLPDGKNFFRLALRNGSGKVIHLATTEKGMGPNVYVFEKSSTAKERLIYVCDNDNGENVHVEHRSKRTRRANITDEDPFVAFFSPNGGHHMELTMFQVDAGWFLLRTFRFTSLVSGNVLAHCFRQLERFGHSNNSLVDLEDAENEQVQAVEYLRALGHFPKYKEEGDAPLPDLSDFRRGGSCKLYEIKMFCRDRMIPHGKLSWTDADATNMQRVKQLIETHNPADAPRQSSFMSNVFFQAWFLQPRKGAHSAAMAAGTRNEPKILKGLMDFINKHTNAEDCVEFTVKGGPNNDADIESLLKINCHCLRTTGIIVNCNCESIGTSPDGLLKISLKPTCNKLEELFQMGVGALAEEKDSDEWDEEIVVAVEVKTRTAPGTIEALAQKARIPDREDPACVGVGPLSVCYLRGVDPDYDARIYAAHVPNINDRRQCLHHAGALCTRHVIYSEATDRGIGRVVLIIFPRATLTLYTEILQRLTEDHLGWVYGTNPIPSFTSAELHHVVDLHTLEQQLTIWHAAMNQVRTGGAPLCSIERIVPAIVSNWNCSKGGADVLSALLQHVNSPAIRHMNIEAVLWDTHFRTVLTQAFHVWRWSAAGLKHIKEAKSFGQITRLGSKDGKSFPGFISHAMKFFSEHAMKAQSAPASPDGREATAANLARALNSTTLFPSFFNSLEGRKYRGNGEHVHYSHSLHSPRVCRLCHGLFGENNPAAPKKPVHRTSFECITCTGESGGEACAEGITLCRILRKHELDDGKYVSCWDLFHSASFTIPTYEQILNLNVAPVAAAAAAAAVDFD